MNQEQEATVPATEIPAETEANEVINLLDILYYPDKFLKTTCEPVDKFDKDLKSFAQSMIVTMLVNQGYGLSATQVHDTRRVIVVTVNGMPTVMVNPEITSKKGETKGWEGCLSFPGFKTLVKRASEVIVSYQDETGEGKVLDTSTLDMTTNLLTPSCIQHEVDHLNGIVFTDLLSPLKVERAKHTVEKFLRAQKRIDKLKKSR